MVRFCVLSSQASHVELPCPSCALDEAETFDPDPPDWREAFPRFAEAVRARCEKGEAEYGDRSFRRPLGELLDEVAEELLDVCGGGFVLWCRVESLKRRLQTGDPTDGGRPR